MIILIAVLLFVNNIASESIGDVPFPDTTFCYFSKENIERPIDSGNKKGGHCNNSLVPTEICTFYSLYALDFDIDVNIELPPANGEGSFDDMNSMKIRDADFNILLTLKSDVFGEVISDKQKRAKLLKKLRGILDDNDLNGIDFFLNSTTVENKDDINVFLIEASKELTDKGFRLVVSLEPYDELIGSVYDVSVISQYAELVVIRTDLLFDVDSIYTVPRNPLHSLKVNIPEIPSYSIESSVTSFLNAGLNRRKTIVNISPSGLSFKTDTSNYQSVGISVVDIGEPGPYSVTPGSLAYFEICEQYNNKQLTVTNSNDNGYSVAVNGNNWIGFTDVNAASQVGIFIYNNNLKGVGISNVCDDDYDGRCQDGIFPLILSVSNAMFVGFDKGPQSRGITGLGSASLVSETAELSNINKATLESVPVISTFV